MTYLQAIHLHDKEEEIIGTVAPVDQPQFNGDWSGVMEMWDAYISTHEDADVEEFCHIWNSDDGYLIQPLSIYFYQPA